MDDIAQLRKEFNRLRIEAHHGARAHLMAAGEYLDHIEVQGYARDNARICVKASRELRDAVTLFGQAWSSATERQRFDLQHSEISKRLNAESVVWTRSPLA